MAKGGCRSFFDTRHCSTKLDYKRTFKLGRAGANQQVIELEKCPANYFTQDHFFLYSLYNHYKEGFLPKPGGILSQPAIYVQAMNIIKGEISRIEEEKHDKKTRKSPGRTR